MFIKVQPPQEKRFLLKLGHIEIIKVHTNLMPKRKKDLGRLGPMKKELFPLQSSGDCMKGEIYQ